MPYLFNDAEDDQLAFDACSSFEGGQVSFKRANLLSANQAAYLENMNIELNGQLKKRRGSRPVGLRFFNGNARVQGIFYYETPSVMEVISFSGGNAYYYNSGAWSSLFAAGMSNPNEIPDIVQLTDKIYWTDSNKSHIRYWNGSVVNDMTASPAAQNISVHGTRLVASGVTTSPAALYFSSFLPDPTSGSSWDLTNLRLDIGNGDGDPIVGHASWNDTTILVCKRSSTYVVDANPIYSTSNPGASITTANYSVKLVHGSIGCVAKKTICQVGQDILFLSRNGVVSAQKQLATSNNQISTPVSQPIQDVINKIRWEYAYKASAKFYNNRYILCVPVNSTEPNTTLVFNTLTNGWSVFTGWSVSCFLMQPYNGGARLLYGTTDGSIYEWLDYESSEGTDSYQEAEGRIPFPITFPVTFPTSQDLTSTLRTRAMTFNEPFNPKSGFYLEMEYVTDSVSFEVNAILDGQDAVTLDIVNNDIGQVPFPITFPVTFPESGGWAKQRLPLHHLDPFREIQIEVICTSGALNIHEITLSAFVDTMELRRN